MSDREWGMISSGATFEGLVSALVYFEDAAAAIFGRRGKDGGQDVRSGDGKTVYQAKFHQDASAQKAIKDAKAEAAKLSKYRDPSHPSFKQSKQWEGVTNWILVTNATFNPMNRQMWDAEVKPLFAKLGLTASYWGQGDLDVRLNECPQVDRSYFHNQTRVLLSLPEAQERIALDLQFLPRAARGTLRGRDHEMVEVASFLRSDKSFLVISGSGGVGKTKVLIESGIWAAAKGWQVLWANIASMEASGNWFEAIVPERETLLLVDEPDDEDLLRQLVEQVSVGRAAKWKVAVAVRSPKDPVIRFLSNSRMSRRRQDLPLMPLPAAAAEQFCGDLLDAGVLSKQSLEWKANAAKKLSRLYDGVPIWISLAVELLETKGDLGAVPKTAQGLAEEYLREIFESQADYPSDQLRRVVRWIALIGPINREDEAAVGLLLPETRFESQSALLACCERLVARRVFVKRGARDRLVEVKPDVLRDYVLRTWLVQDVGASDDPLKPTEMAEALVAGLIEAIKNGSLNTLGGAILRSLARTEVLLRRGDQPVQLLAAFFKGLIDHVGSLSASARVVAAKAATEVGAASPEDSVALSRTLRTTPCDTQNVRGLFGDRTIGKDEVVLELGWLVYHAALGARTADERRSVLCELVALVEADADVATRLRRGLPNDGKRAAQLLERVLEGGPQFASEFDVEAQELSFDALSEIERGGPFGEARRQALEILLGAQVSVERRQTFNDDLKLVIQTYAILPGKDSWKIRERVVQRIREMIDREATPADAIEALWSVLSKAHLSAMQGYDRINSADDKKQVKQDLLADLTWARESIQRRPRGLKELVAARKLWDWHRRFDKDPEFVAIAGELEAVFLSNNLNSEFEPLTNYDESELQDQRAAEKTATLLRENRASAITEFIERAIRFFGKDSQIHRLAHVAAALGSNALTSTSVGEFVAETLKQSEQDDQFYFATLIVRSWAATLRKTLGGRKAAELMHDLLMACATSERKARLIFQAYRYYTSEHLGEMEAAEHLLVRANSSSFIESNMHAVFFVAFAWSFSFDWLGYKATAKQVVDSAPLDALPVVIQQLYDGVYWGVRRLPVNVAPPADFTEWLLDQLLRIDDLGVIDDMAIWNLEQILKRFNPPSIGWLIDRLLLRIETPPTTETEELNVPLRQRLSKFVSPLTADDASREDIREKLRRFLRAGMNVASLEYQLPKYARDLDPTGLLIPEIVIVEIRAQGSTTDLLWNWVRLAGAYPINSDPWRKIAAVVGELVSGVDEKTRLSLFLALSGDRSRSFSSAPGEVPELFHEQVRRAQELLDDEGEARLVAYWRWNLASAEAELREQQERAKEERGE